MVGSSKAHSMGTFFMVAISDKKMQTKILSDGTNGNENYKKTKRNEPGHRLYMVGGGGGGGE